MSPMKNYIGFDAHSTTCTFAVVDKEGNLITRDRLKTTERNQTSFVTGLKGENYLVVEESTISQWISRPYPGDYQRLSVSLAKIGILLHDR